MTALTMRLFGLSLRLPTRLVVVNLILSLLVVSLATLALLRGAYPIPLSGLFEAMTGAAGPVAEMIVLENRLPRVLTALGVGLALGMAGEMVQTMLRNPLASPDILGFSAGASVGAVASVLITGGLAAVLVGAVAGGVGAAALIMALSWRGQLSTNQIVLTGIGVMVSLTVITELMLSRLNENNAAALLKWLVGSFGHRSLNDTGGVWLGLAVITPLVLWHQFRLSRAVLGDVTAQSLGVTPQRSHLITLILAVALVALSVAAAGPLSFLAFVAGPIAHGINGRPRPTVMTAALVGAGIALVADAASQSLPIGFALPAGVFTALIGAPVLLWVLIMQNRKRF